MTDTLEAQKVEEERAAFDLALAEAQSSGRPYRLEHDISTGESSVIYLTAQEIADAVERCKEEQKVNDARAAQKAAALLKLQALGITPDDIRAALER